MANLVTYAKQVWQDAKTAITAARLNNMEKGISDCATQINKLGDSVSPLKTFFTGDKSSVTLSFASANHSTALLISDNNGAPSVIFLNCMDSTNKVLAGQSISVTFPNNKSSVIKVPNWSYVLVMTPNGGSCSISVA